MTSSYGFGATSLISYVVLWLGLFVGFFMGLDFNKEGKSFTDGFLMGFLGTLVSAAGLLAVAVIFLLILGSI